MESVADIPKIAHLGIDPNAEMAINCEWVWIPLDLLRVNSVSTADTA